jgi:hypothetical protein
LIGSAHTSLGKRKKKSRKGGDRSPPEGPFSGDHFVYILVSILGRKIGPCRLVLMLPSAAVCNDHQRLSNLRQSRI